MEDTGGSRLFEAVVIVELSKKKKKQKRITLVDG